MKRFSRIDRRFFVSIFIVWSIAMLTILVGGCKTIKIEGGSHSKDSVRVEHRVDTFYLEFIDSIRIQMPCSDTIQVAYVDRVRYKTQKEVHYLHDTISVCTIDTLYQPYEIVKEKEVTGGFAKFCIGFFIIFIILVVSVVSLRVLKKYYFHV